MVRVVRLQLRRRRGGDRRGRRPRRSRRCGRRRPRFVELADRVGLDTLAELWRDSDPQTLPGALWVLYVLRQWCRSSPEEVALLWRAGAPYAPADAVVAGMGEPVDVTAVRRLSDDVLTGAYRGELDVALERAAAVFRVVAAGRREGPCPDAERATALEMAERNDRTADALAAAARRWRRGELS